LKRAFPQKVKSVSRHCMAADITIVQSKQGASGVNRKVRTSAAMVGLALSMGASGLLLPRQSDGATAAEPQVSESAISAAKATQVTPLVSATGVVADATMANMLSHVVMPGQTLWQIAHRYHVAIETLAAANRLTPGDVLQIGQVLEIPSVQSPSGASESSLEASVQPQQSPDAELAVNPDRHLKVQQDEALSRLRQSRASLRNSLAGLQSEAPRAQTSVPDQEAEIPKSSATQVSAQPSSLSQNSAARAASESLTYQVKPGDTLGAIAHAHQVTRRDLAIANRLSNPNRLQVAQSLVIPQPHPATSLVAIAQPVLVATVPPVVDAATVSQPEAVSSANSANVGVYRVEQGDTIGQIANLYNIPQSALVGVNQLSNPNQILVNQVLTIPVYSGAEPATIAVTPPADSTPVANHSLPEAVAPVAVSSPAVLPEFHPLISVPTVPTASSVLDANTVAVVPPTASETATLPEAQPPVVATRFAPTERSRSAHSSQPDAQRATNPYVEHLMTEILSLRDRYRSEAAQGLTPVPQPTVVATAPIAQPVPTIDPTALSNASSTASRDQFTQAFQAEVRRLQQEQRRQGQSIQATDSPTVSAAPASATVASPTVAVAAPIAAPVPTAATATAPSVETRGQVVAVAPLGSENYEPLVQPLTGRVVSPNLPPLSGAEAYLPESTPTFNGYRWPTQGVITSGFGRRWGRLHAGIDIGAPIGTPVIAAAAGEIVFAGWNSGGYGNMVDIRHADGSLTRYAHNSRLLVRTGQRIEQGQQISLVGSTGYSTGPHLHFEVHPAGQGAVNPIAYLPRTREG
jgi:murein DD-endopeptidase MepM/ murein hydrolase activator NlpD